MRHKTRTSSLVALALGAILCAAPPDARAGDEPPPAQSKWELGGFLGAHLYSPTNNFGRNRDTRPDIYSLNHGLIAGLRLGYYFIPRLGLEGEIGIIPTGTKGSPTASTMPGPGVQATALVYRGHLLFHILTGRVRPFILGGYGGASLLSSNRGVVYNDTDGMFHVGAGVKVDVDKLRHWGLRLDGRMLLPASTEYWPNREGEKNGGKIVTFDWEVTLGMYGLFPFNPPPEKPKDSDNDGVPDTTDKCPAEAGVADNDGCPDKDGDGDGIVDRLDKCKEQAGVKEMDGCPWPDTDGDGILDKDDKCPDKAGVAEVQGCPWPDTDGDGTLDKDDKCVDKAGPKQNGGCPDTDGDADGVVDRLDQCKDKQGPAGNHGCPIPDKLKKFTGAIKGIEFETGSAVILKKSYSILDSAFKVLDEFKDVKVEIAGHTDNTGDHDKNVKLSQDRAQSVKDYLVKKGLADGRLVPKGYGPDKPIADNAKPAGRAKNRRVEFNLVADADGEAPPIKTETPPAAK